MESEQQDSAKVLELLETEKIIKISQLCDYLRTYKLNKDVTIKVANLILSRLESSRSKKSELKEVARELTENDGMNAIKDILENENSNSPQFTEAIYHIIGLLARIGTADILLSIEKSGIVLTASQAICDCQESPLWITYALAGVSTSKTCATEISTHSGTIDSILKVLGTHCGNSDDVVLHSLTILSSVAHFSPEVSVRIVSGEGLGTILSILKEHAAPGADTSGDICMLALQLLCAAARASSSSAASIVIGGGVETCVWGMKAWPDNAEAQRWGCTLLGLLSRASNAEKKEFNKQNNSLNLECDDDEIAAAGGISAIVAALKIHSDSPRVLRQAFKTLGIIASQRTQNANLVATAVYGVEPTIASSMRRFKDDPELLGAACFAIASIAAGCKDAGGRLLSAGAGDIALHALRAHRDVDRIQHYGCTALGTLAAADPVNARKRLLGNKALELTADIMRTAPTFGRAQASACTAILSYLESDETYVRSKLFQLNIPTLISSAMERFADSAEVQEAVLEVLASLASDRDTAAKLGESAGNTLIPRAIDTLRRFTERPDIQARCCAFLVGASSKIPANNSAIAAARGAEAVLAAMVAHSEDARLQALGCRCLANFGHDSENRNIMGYGGIEAVLSAVAKHSGYADLRHWACIALANGTRDSLDNQLMFVAKGGLEFAVNTVKMSAESAIDKSTRYFAIIIIANACSEDSRTRHILRCIGGLEAILAFLRDERNEQAQTAGLQALALATKDTKTNALVVGQLGGISLVLPALRHFSRSVDLQEWGLCALEHITFNVPENQQVHWPGTAAETVLRSIRKNKSSPNVVLWGLRILANVTYGPQNEGNTADIRKNMDGLKAVVAAMKDNGSVSEIQRWGCVVFQTLAAEGVEGRSALAQVKATDAVLAAVAAHKGSLEVQECALYALGWILVDSTVAERKKITPIIELAKSAFPSSKVLKELLELFKCENGKMSISNVMFSPYAYNVMK